jgi:hypothetical protein
MFFVLVLGIFIMLVFFSIYGFAYKLICQTYIRWMITDVIQFISDAMIILSIINLHFSTLGDQESQPVSLLLEDAEAKPAESVQDLSDDEEIEEVEYAAEQLTGFELFKAMNQGEYSHLLS